MKSPIFKIFIFLCIYSKLFSQDSINTDFSKLYYNQSKSPSTAILLSSVLPGSGQIYNESYYKAPIIWGSLAFFGYYFKIYQDKYDDYSKIYKHKLMNNEPDAQSYSRIRNFYYKRRDEMGLYLLLIYVANIIDAYVDSHLFDFNVIPPSNQPLISYPKSTYQFNIKIPF